MAASAFFSNFQNFDLTNFFFIIKTNETNETTLNLIVLSWLCRQTGLIFYFPPAARFLYLQVKDFRTLQKQSPRGVL